MLCKYNRFYGGGRTDYSNNVNIASKKASVILSLIAEGVKSRRRFVYAVLL